MLDGNPDEPGRFGREFMLMREMGWSWDDLLNTPFPVLEEIAERLSAINHWERVANEQRNSQP